MRVNKITCSVCGKQTNSRHPYCIHCFTPLPKHKPKPSMLHEALLFIVVLLVIAIAVITGNIVYSIFR